MRREQIVHRQRSRLAATKASRRSARDRWRRAGRSRAAPDLTSRAVEAFDRGHQPGAARSWQPGMSMLKTTLLQSVDERNQRQHFGRKWPTPKASGAPGDDRAARPQSPVSQQAALEAQAHRDCRCAPPSASTRPRRRGRRCRCSVTVLGLGLTGDIEPCDSGWNGATLTATTLLMAGKPRRRADSATPPWSAVADQRHSPGDRRAMLDHSVLAGALEPPAAARRDSRGAPRRPPAPSCPGRPRS